MIVAFEELPGGMSEFMEMIGGAETGGAGAENEDFHDSLTDLHKL